MPEIFVKKVRKKTCKQTFSNIPISYPKFNIFKYASILLLYSVLYSHCSCRHRVKNGLKAGCMCVSGWNRVFPELQFLRHISFFLLISKCGNQPLTK